MIYPNLSWKPQVGADGKRLAKLIEDELVGDWKEEQFTAKIQR